MPDLAVFELEPSAELRPHVHRAAGYTERPERPIHQPELPFAGTVVILVLGERLEIDGQRIGSFATGVFDRPAMTMRSGAQSGLQLNLTPLGARRLFGVPMDELANRTVALEDVLGPAAQELVERVQEATSWPARWALVQDAVARRMRDAPEPHPAVAHAYERIVARHGRVRVEALADEVGWSRRHLATRFRREVGVTPKTLARIARFERAHTLLARPDATLAGVAYDCGYADQPHFNREFRDLAWATPGTLLAHAQHPFVQDSPAAA